MEIEETNLVPLDDCVVIEIGKKETESEGGIVLTAEYSDRKQMSIVEGILIKSGDLAFYDIISNEKEYPKIGDRVYFKRYSGILHSEKEGNREFKIIRDQDIYAFERCNDE